MIAIQVPEETAKALAIQAEAAGLSLEGYLGLVAGIVPGVESKSDQEFDAELDQIAQPGPTLPADFSRADIY
jgi:hypothetical protein